MSSRLSWLHFQTFECLIWARAHVSSSDSESEFEDPILIDTTQNAYFALVYFLKTNVGSSGPSAHSAKCGVTATARGTQIMLIHL
jgi:hypothetical protein